ncbi:uncharacterized protein LY89DRAFT_430873 [Mollisia scopiformis]|uniref:C2H2-type domain-containing protein n=1 Tax=Mollisia scopiformis TaxID=149040 RepID=A0A194XM38_MOLSC|nr:uncharacterized protein LY89DRAFT_430873 [Mollisia scopiformis]KUJ21243.1 hypothetical protein LY89DRAFT_430873 [Mollisia scopiformis]
MSEPRDENPKGTSVLLLQDARPESEKSLHTAPEKSYLSTPSTISVTSPSGSDIDLVESTASEIEMASPVTTSPMVAARSLQANPRKRMQGYDDYQSELVRQSRSSFPNNNLPCLWEQCGIVFSSSTERRNHVRSHTINAVDCRWPGCARSFEGRASLNKHLDTHIKPHACPNPTCQHTAATPRDLERHMDTHQRLLGYYCPIDSCRASRSSSKPAFSRLDNAARHIKRIHPGSSAIPRPKLGAVHNIKL